MLGLCLGSSVLAADPVSTHGALSVSGNRIVDKNNETVALAGVSLFWSNNGWGGERYYRENVVRHLRQDWNASLVRASMGVEESGGYLSQPTANKQRVKTVVDAAIEHGMYVIIDWHSHLAENHTAEALTFFREMATLYGHTHNVIYEIYNEPIHSSWSGAIKPYAETVIAAIRAIDPDNLIIVGTPRWSQNVHEAAANPITGYPNIAYTLHFYAGTHTKTLRDRADQAMASGIALFVTEWGTVEADGGQDLTKGVAAASTEAWIAWMREKQISHANWSFNDKREGASILKLGTNPAQESWPESDLTESGLLVKELILGWEYDMWLVRQGLPGDSAPSSDPFNTGRTLFFDFAFGINPSDATPLPELTIATTADNTLVARFAARQASVSYILESSNAIDSWSDLSRMNGTGEWVEIELSPDTPQIYQIKATRR